MKKRMGIMGLFLTVCLSGCSENTEKVKLEEVGGQVYLIEQETGEVYQIKGEKKLLIEALPSSNKKGKDKTIIEDVFSLPNGLIINGRFKVTDGRVAYIFNISDIGYEKIVDETVDLSVKVVDGANKKQDENQADKEHPATKFERLRKYDSDGFKMIQIISDNDETRFDQINLEFKDEDGFTILKESVKFTGMKFSRITGLGEDYVGIRLEGSVIGSRLTPDSVSSINHTYNGFTLD
jgi:hypothetical protein